MRRWLLFVVLLGGVALALPLVASAGGWAGSIYDKSECTYSKETNSLFCETTVTVEAVATEIVSPADASCPSGTRRVSRTGTRIEVSHVFDTYTGHTPVAKHNVFGQTTPLSEEWRDFTDTDLGCG